MAKGERSLTIVKKFKIEEYLLENPIKTNETSIQTINCAKMDNCNKLCSFL